MEDERDALKNEYERIRRDNQGMKDTLDKDPSKQKASENILLFSSCFYFFNLFLIYFLISFVPSFFSLFASFFSSFIFIE